MWKSYVDYDDKRSPPHNDGRIYALDLSTRRELERIALKKIRKKLS